MTCISGKKSFPTKEIAEDALIEAWSVYDYSRGSGPVNVYQCDDCGNFHFTSKGELNSRLSDALKEGKIKLHSEANVWLGRIRKK